MKKYRLIRCKSPTDGTVWVQVTPEKSVGIGEKVNLTQKEFDSLSERFILKEVKEVPRPEIKTLKEAVASATDKKTRK